jgi:hypothetical protein
MVNIAHGGMDHRATAEKPKTPPKELEHVRLSEAENGGHIAEHHFTSYEHPPEQHVFSKAEEGAQKPMLPEGHVLHHLAKAMHIPHSVIEAKEESADKVDSKGHESDEEEELEAE